jgi:PAS domain S-box-containing protein
VNQLSLAAGEARREHLGVLWDFGPEIDILVDSPSLDVRSAPLHDVFGVLIETLPDAVVVTTPAGEIVAVNQQLATLSGYTREQLVGAQIEKLVPTRLRAEHVAERAAYLAEDGGMRSMSGRADIALVRADNREVPVDVALSTIGDGAGRLVVASVRDASVRRSAEVARDRENRFLTAMNDITAALFSDGAIDETLRAIAHRTRQLLDAPLAIVAVPQDDPALLQIKVADGYGGDILEGQTVPCDGSVAGAVMREHQPFLVADSSNDARVHQPGWPDDLGPALFVPLHARNETVGILAVVNRRDSPMFRPTDVTLMKAFAAHATIAILDARAQQQLRRVELLEDRERVALAMTDGVISRISSASLTLHGALCATLPGPVADRLHDAVDELDAAIGSIRDAVFPR